METGSVNAIGSAVGVSGLFMVISLRSNNVSQLLCNLPERRACTVLCSDKITGSSENNATLGVLNPECRKELTKKKKGFHLPSSLMANGFDSCLVQFP